MGWVVLKACGFCVFVMPGNCFGCLSVAFFAQGISFFKINTFFLPKYLVVEKNAVLLHRN